MAADGRRQRRRPPGRVIRGHYVTGKRPASILRKGFRDGSSVVGKRVLGDATTARSIGRRNPISVLVAPRPGQDRGARRRGRGRRAPRRERRGVLRERRRTRGARWAWLALALVVAGVASTEASLGRRAEAAPVRRPPPSGSQLRLDVRGRRAPGRSAGRHRGDGDLPAHLPAGVATQQGAAPPGAVQHGHDPAGRAGGGGGHRPGAATKSCSAACRACSPSSPRWSSTCWSTWRWSSW